MSENKSNAEVKQTDEMKSLIIEQDKLEKKNDER